MYVIVRKDLEPKAQLTVQSIHGSIEAAREFIKEGDEHPSVIVLVVKNENKLIRTINELEGKVNFKIFREPDQNNAITALASEPVIGEQRKLFARFQLLQ